MNNSVICFHCTETKRGRKQMLMHVKAEDDMNIVTVIQIISVFAQTIRLS